MQGCANDYIYLDCRAAGAPPAQIAEWCRALSPRHFSVGADGIICICPPKTPGAHAQMRMFNADGSEGRMCGNGIRCVAQFLREDGLEAPALRIDTLSGLKTLRWQGEGLWQVEMGRYSTLPADLPAVDMGDTPLIHVPLSVQGRTYTVTCVSVGNPHCVVPAADVASLALEALGPAFETHPHFPQQINTEFIRVVDPHTVEMRVWERGSGETLACGTGACAVAAACVENGWCPAGEDIRVLLRGGQLTIRVQPDRSLLMTGPAKRVYDGEAEV